MALAHQRRGDQEVGSRPVAGNRDIAHNRDPEQGLDVRIMRARLQWIPKEHQQIIRPKRSLPDWHLVTLG